MQRDLALANWFLDKRMNGAFINTDFKVRARVNKLSPFYLTHFEGFYYKPGTLFLTAGVEKIRETI